MNEPEMPGPDVRPTTFNVLFVCSGNTCRSPMAAGIARSLIGGRGWNHVAIESAGVAAGTGSPAADAAVRVAAGRGIDLSDHVSKPLTPALVQWADLVLAMSDSHVATVADLGGGAKVSLITDFIDGPDAGLPIEDPFGGDELAYRAAFEQLYRAVSHVLNRLEPILAP